MHAVGAGGLTALPSPLDAPQSEAVLSADRLKEVAIAIADAVYQDGDRAAWPVRASRGIPKG